MVQDDLKISILLNQRDGQLMGASSGYNTLRQFLLSYEQHARWTTTNLGGQADMDISRIKEAAKRQRKREIWSRKRKVWKRRKSER